MVNNEEEKLRQQSIEMNINMDLGWNDEDSEDEYADRYDENEDQGDMPHDVDVETYFSSNEKDLCSNPLNCLIFISAILIVEMAISGRNCLGSLI